MFDHPSTSRLWKFIDRISRPMVLAALVPVYLIFPLVLFPAAADGFDKMPLDLMFAYSPEQAYSQLASFGPEGRANYAASVISVDLAYPVIYTLMLAVWLCLLLRGRNRYCSQLSMLPFGIFIFDLIENVGILLMLANFPTEIVALALLTSAATTIKWLIAVPVVLLVLGLSIKRAVQLLRPRKSTAGIEKTII